MFLCCVSHIARQTNCSYKVHTHETGRRFDQQRKRSNNPFPFFPLFSKSGEEVQFLQGETNPAGRPNQDDPLLCSNLCLHADRLQRERLPLAKHWPVPKNFQPVGFVSPSDRKLSPPPLLSSSTPPSAEVGVLREHRAYRCWCSTAKAVPTSAYDCDFAAQ